VACRWHVGGMSAADMLPPSHGAGGMSSTSFFNLKIF
jgi:hypothetical protein